MGWKIPTRQKPSPAGKGLQAGTVFFLWTFTSFTSAAAAVRESGTLTATNRRRHTPDPSSVGPSVSIFEPLTSFHSDSFIKPTTFAPWHLQDLQDISKPIQMDGHGPDHSAKSATRRLSAISSRKSPHRQLNNPTALSRPESSPGLLSHNSQVAGLATRTIQATRCLWSSPDSSNYKSPSSHHRDPSPPI